MAFLWYWGATLSRTYTDNGPPLSSKVVTAITVPIAVLMWSVGIILYLGLPNYYRRDPGNVPSFYRSLFRRKVVVVSPINRSNSLFKRGLILILPAVVLRHGPFAKLFPFANLQPQLEVSLEVIPHLFLPLQ